MKWATMRLDERLRQSFCISMNPRRIFRPDLNDCGLEDRLAPVIANLGVIVLTTGGYMLLIPFPGAYVSPASPGSSSGPATASSVSGTAINTTLMPPAGSLPGSFPGGPTPILRHRAPGTGCPRSSA